MEKLTKRISKLKYQLQIGGNKERIVPEILNWYDTPHVQPVFSEGPGLVETEGVDCTAEVDATRTDAEDVPSPQPFLCKHDADRHRRGQRWRNDDCDEIQCTTNDQTHSTAVVNLHTTIITLAIQNKCPTCRFMPDPTHQS